MHFPKLPGQVAIMPVGFGIAGGPRQVPDQSDYEHRPTRYTRHIVSFLTDAAALQAILPEGLALRGEPVVSFHFVELRDIAWLAGRGYNMLAMYVPVTFTGESDQIEGQYQAVLWENLGDPIITGREQLGHPKLYAELPDPHRWQDKVTCRASWCGFEFLRMELECEEPLADGAAMAGAFGSGIIGYKYIPKTGSWDEADAAYFTLTPLPGRSNEADPPPPPDVRVGQGMIRFNEATWRDMPTQAHIVNILAALPQVAARGAMIVTGHQYADCLDQRIIG